MLYIFSWLLWGLISAGILLFAATCIHERDMKALFKCVVFLLPLSALLAAVLIIDFPGKQYVAAAIMAIFLCAIIAFTFPGRKSSPLRVIGRQSRVDERDAFFHRFYRIRPGDGDLERYYAENPEKRVVDEKIRALPNLGEPGSRTYNRMTTPFHASIFSVLDRLTSDVEDFTMPEHLQRAGESRHLFTRRIKGFARYLGADLVGTTKLNPEYVYSHIGRGQGRWGDKIELDHSYAIAIAVKMDHDMIRHSPGLPGITETSRIYFESAKIATILARYINMLGYASRAHVDGNYRVMVVPVAADAGLGELGRLGLLITPEYGPRVRLAVVTTDMPLEQDEQMCFGVQHFCSICKKCAEHCPSNSISDAGKKTYAGVEKWQSAQDSCYKYWRLQGTDCSLCIKVCPYAYPETTLHNMIRWLVKRNGFARRMVLLGDRIFYNHRYAAKFPLPEWFDSV